MTESSDQSFSKQDSIRMVLRDYRFFYGCIQNRQTPDDDQFLELHDRLMPELGHEVGRARRLLLMQQEAERRKVSVVCPSCSERYRVSPDEAADELFCSTCDSTFRITTDETQEGSTAEFPFGTRADGLVAGSYLGEYRLERAVGRGGFGAVWCARDTTLNRIVAVKILTRLTGEDKARFELEAEAAARLQHPNIVEIHRAGELEGRLCIVSRFIKGTSLRDVLRSESPVSPELACDWCSKLADALDHAHRAQIVHRDVKPENILLDEIREPFLTDFGLARDLTHETVMTQDKAVLGSPAYMSPQQAAGSSHELDGRTDVYSLGVVLYELLTGFRPFRGSNVQSLIRQIIDDAPVPARRENVNVPTDVDTICSKCLQKNPEDRYATAGDLAADLKRFLNREPITARPISPALRLWRWCQRKPALAGTISSATLIVLTTVVTAFSLITAAFFREQEAHATAEDRRKETIEWLNVAHGSLGSSYLQLGELFSLFPQMKAAYAGFLTEGAAQYERLAAVKSDDPALELERARVLLILGDIRLELSDTAKAKSSYQSARTILAGLTHHESHEEVRVEIANCGVRLASVSVREGQQKLAATLLSESIEVLNELSRTAETGSYTQYSLASALLNQGSLLLELGQPIDAALPLGQATDIFSLLLEREPGNSELLTGLVKSITLLGQSASGKGSHAEAVQRMTEGLKLLEEKEYAFRHNVPVLETRASSHIYLAQALTDSGLAERAIAEYRSSVESWRLLLELAPDVPRYSENFVLRQVDLGQAFHDMRRLEDALATLEPALAQIDERLNADNSSRVWIYARGLCLDSLARVLADQGQYETAHQYADASGSAFEFLVSESPDEADYRMRYGIALRHIAQTLYLLGRSNDALTSINHSGKLFQQLLSESPDWHIVREQTAFNARSRALIAWSTDDASKDASQASRNAVAVWEQICATSSSPRFRKNFAWYLLESPDTDARDYQRALQMARTLVTELPSAPSCQALLGAALALAGDHDEASEILTELTSTNSKGDPREWFYLAICRAQIDTKSAKNAFQRGLNLMNEQTPGNPWLGRLKDDVAELLSKVPKLE